MEKYNRLGRANVVAPNYPIANKPLELLLFISPEKELCTVAQLDNNYICWLSFSSLDDSEQNAAVFNHLFGYRYTKISNLHRVLQSRYSEVTGWRQLLLQKQHYKDDMRYRYPGSGAFFGDNGHDNGRGLANDLNVFYLQEQAKCQFRLLNPSYTAILQQYHTLLAKEEPYSYYYEMKPLIDILESENYLKLCPSAPMRELYSACLAQCARLYGCYMDAVR